MIEDVITKARVNPIYYSAVGLVLLYALTKSIKGVYNFISSKVNSRKWERIAKKVRSERDKKIDSFITKNSDKISSERIEEIISLDVTELSQKIKEKKISSQEAVLAYILRSATIGKDLNLIANINYSEAMEAAIKADEMINSRNVDELPPLIGVPVSIKDHITVKNVPMTLGLASFHDNIKEFDSLMVKVLREKGAIPFVISNLPQGIYALESTNHLFGSALNPWNKSKTTGGSSGGEAGLVSARCSPFGIGSDIGGSIRIPAAYCGLYGFKPTSTRISCLGVVNPTKDVFTGFNSIRLSLGPLCRTARDVITISENLFGNFSQDVYCDNTPLNKQILEEPFTKRPKIGYFFDSKFGHTAQDIKDKMNSLFEHLVKEGYEVVPFEFGEIDELIDLGMDLTLNSGILESILENAQGEKLVYFHQNFKTMLGLPLWLIHLLGRLFNLGGEKLLGNQMLNTKFLNKDDFLEINKKLAEKKQKFIQYFQDNDFYALICPSSVCPAIDFGAGFDILTLLTKFQFLFNVLDMPCVNVPIGLLENSNYTRKVNQYHDKIVEGLMKTSQGLPVGLSVATMPKQDEKCLKIMLEVDNFFRFDLNHSKKVLNKLNKN